jgi:hypothetical protein
VLPAAPTEIRKLDGIDFSISNYVIQQSKTGAAREPILQECSGRAEG